MHSKSEPYDVFCEERFCLCWHLRHASRAIRCSCILPRVLCVALSVSNSCAVTRVSVFPHVVASDQCVINLMLVIYSFFVSFVCCVSVFPPGFTSDQYVIGLMFVIYSLFVSLFIFRLVIHFVVSFVCCAARSLARNSVFAP